MAVSTIPDAYEKPYTLARVEQTVTAPQNFPLRAMIEQHRDVLTPLCGPGVDLERVISQLWVAAQKERRLLQCTPASVIPAISRALEVGGVIGRDVHLLVFGKEATDCLDYKFMAELVIAAGGARSIDARVVYQGDTFTVEYGTNPHITHVPAGFGKARGPMVGAYAVAFLGMNTPPKFVALRMEQIEATRAKSQSWAKLRECPEWYAAKCAVRQLFKLLPKNPKLASVMARIDAVDRVHEAEDAEFAEQEGFTIPAEEPRPAHITEDGEDVRDQYQDAPSETFGDDEPETVPLAAALAWKVNKQPLGASRNTGLTKIREWAVGKQESEGDDQGRLAYIIACCDTILAARLAGEIAEPEKKEAA